MSPFVVVVVVTTNALDRIDTRIPCSRPSYREVTYRTMLPADLPRFSKTQRCSPRPVFASLWHRPPVTERAVQHSRMSSVSTHATLGRTGLTVNRLGFGAMELRPRPDRPELDDQAIERLLNQVLDRGINFIDTSPDYGPSEDHIGRSISHRRDEYFLASKCGCVVDPESPGRFEHRYDRATIRDGVERSLRRLRTDHLDLVQFHISPAVSVLAENDSIAELRALQDEGKVRFIGMSGTLPNIIEQLDLGEFDAFQIPYSAVEHEHDEIITRAASEGAGTIIRGGVAKGLSEPPPPSKAQPPGWREAFVLRKERFSEASLDDLLDGDTPAQFLLRFTLAHRDIHTVIVGTSNAQHLDANLDAAARGPLPDDVYARAKERFGHP